MKRGSKTAGPGQGVAVLLVDVINGFDFAGSAGLLRAAARSVPQIEKLVARARAARVPVIYVNDNFGRWRSDFQATVEACTAPGQPGRHVSARLSPQTGDYFVLKPLHSGFHSTPLELLLQQLDIGTLVLAGFATNLCVTFTANDAHMLGYRLFVPRDCTASNTASLTRSALEHIEIALRGDIRAERSIQFGRLRNAGRRARRARGSFD